MIQPVMKRRRGRRAGKTAWASLGLVLALVGCAAMALAQGPASPGPDGGQIIQFLNQTIAWYRQVPALESVVTNPGDWMTAYDNQQTANQVVQLAFTFARAQADALAKESGADAGQNSAGSATQLQALRGWQKTIDKDFQDTQTERDADIQKLASATGARRKELQATISELQGELALAQARKDALNSMMEFMSQSGGYGSGATGLRAQVEALASSVPAASAPTTSAARSRAASAAEANALAASANQPQASGLWGLTQRVFALWGNARTLDSAMQQTNALAAVSTRLRAPLLGRLRALSQQGDVLAKQADTANPVTLLQEKQQLDSLAAAFKQVSAALVPLSKQRLLLDAYTRNLAGWRNSVQAEFHSALRGLLARVGILVVLLALVIVAAEIWRRAIFRYARDPRRRYQMLLLRKFALWTAIVAIVGLSFVHTLGSVLTFAGLLTAGIAFALQNVILSIVGYFFLIGKFGVKVGDRVQIGAVSGEIVDIGLVRLHLLELGGPNADIPTGRVVAFSNSVVFQNPGLTKRIPGTYFAWHEVTLTLSSETDGAGVRNRLLAAVNAVLADFREEIERQGRRVETYGAGSAIDLHPKCQLRFTPAGIDVLIRFPIDLRHAAEIDERVTRELFRALAQEPKLQLAGSGPGIQLHTTLSATGSSA